MNEDIIQYITAIENPDSVGFDFNQFDLGHFENITINNTILQFFQINIKILIMKKVKNLIKKIGMFYITNVTYPYNTKITPIW